MIKCAFLSVSCIFPLYQGSSNYFLFVKVESSETRLSCHKLCTFWWGSLQIWEEHFYFVQLSTWHPYFFPRASELLALLRIGLACADRLYSSLLQPSCKCQGSLHRALGGLVQTLAKIDEKSKLNQCLLNDLV